MKAIIFSGTTLNEEQLKSFNKPLVWHPPAKAGDLLMASRLGFNKIILVDATFEICPSVWHKEILYLLSLGTDVIGLSSIGALRALELEPFGMQGYGSIFEYYKKHEHESDADVLVSYLPDKNYTSVNLALIDIRLNLEDWVTHNKITANQADGILKASKAIHYSQRDVDAICHEIARLDPTLSEQFSTLHGTDYVSYKTKDVVSYLTEHFDKPVTKTTQPIQFTENTFFRLLLHQANTSTPRIIYPDMPSNDVQTLLLRFFPSYFKTTQRITDYAFLLFGQSNMSTALKQLHDFILTKNKQPLAIDSPLSEASLTITQDDIFTTYGVLKLFSTASRTKDAISKHLLLLIAALYQILRKVLLQNATGLSNLSLQKTSNEYRIKNKLFTTQALDEYLNQHNATHEIYAYFIEFHAYTGFYIQSNNLATLRKNNALTCESLMFSTMEAVGLDSIITETPKSFFINQIRKSLAQLNAGQPVSGFVFDGVESECSILLTSLLKYFNELMW